MSTDVDDVKVACSELTRLLRIKQRLLQESLQQNTGLQRDDDEFLACFDGALSVVSGLADREKREMARRILGHIRQFNPFQALAAEDDGEEAMLAEVVEDFVAFSEQWIEKLGVTNGVRI